MAAGQSAREKLARCLDQEAFDPVLRARPDHHSAADLNYLEHPGRASERTRQRYQGDYARAGDLGVGR